LKDRRESFEDHWRELAEHVLPRSYRYLDEDWSKRGNKANKKIIDPTGTLSLRAMEAAFSASITPTSRPWKKLRLAEVDADHDTKIYLEAVSDTMDSCLLNSNFYQEAGKFYSTCGLFGTAAMLVEEDAEDEISCETLPVGSFWLGIDAKRRVNTFGREIPMTVTQMVEEFGLENVSDYVKSSYENGIGDKQTIKVIHWIGPSRSGGTMRMPFESVYIDPTDNDKDASLRSGGYEEFPVITARWKTMGDDVYGIDCPGMIALGHIKELQHAHKQLAKAIEKLVNPPTQRPEGTMRKGIDVTPGADNVVANRGASTDGIKPLYQITFDVNAVRAHIDDLRSQIREVFFYNLFLMVANERRSGTKAREIDELHEEKMIVLSTVYEQFSHEFLDPFVERVYRILERRGRLPIPPEQMRGESFEVEYVSVMAQAMKLVGIGNMDRALSILGQTASIDPTVLDIADLKRFSESYFERLGIDASVMATPEEREDKQRAREAAAARNQAIQTASVEADVAKNLASAKTDEDNALTQLLGNTIG